MLQDNTEARVLAVDDDEIILIALAETLRHEGYQSVTTQSPREALELLKKGNFSVIISDQRMAEMTGLEFLQEAAKIQPTASRILITGVLTLKTVIDAINSGEIFRFIAKPWLREELLATIRNAAQRHQLLETNRKLQQDTLRLNAQLAETNQKLQLKLRELTAQRDELTQMHEQMRDNFERSLEVAQRITSVYSPTLGERSREVTLLCEMMLDICPLDKNERHALRTAARLHNVGLVGIPRATLDRIAGSDAELNADEQLMLRNSIIDAQMLANYVDPSENAGLLIRAGRERWDGTGFPDGLVGAEIPRPAQMLAIAIWYVESRLDPEKKIDAMLELSGKAFSGEVVGIMVKALRTAKPTRGTKQISLAELRPGMVLAKGFYSPTGMLLVKEGQHITSALLDKIIRQKNEIYDDQKLLVYL